MLTNHGDLVLVDFSGEDEDAEEIYVNSGVIEFCPALKPKEGLKFRIEPEMEHFFDGLLLKVVVIEYSEQSGFCLDAQLESYCEPCFYFSDIPSNVVYRLGKLEEIEEDFAAYLSQSVTEIKITDDRDLEDEPEFHITVTIWNKRVYDATVRLADMQEICEVDLEMLASNGRSQLAMRFE